nr:alpha/beta fold hydrolase [Govania unica]
MIHGAWHAAWSWDKLIPHLTARGLTVHALDLPGHGADYDLDKQTLANYADHVTAFLDSLDAPAMIVGHSMSGAVLSEVAERRPDRITLLVYLTAYLLPDGVAMAKVMKEDTESTAARFSQKLPDAPAVLMSEEGLRTAVYEGCDPAEVTAIIARVQPQAIKTFTTPVHVTPENFGRVPRAYIECTRDKAISLTMQQRMQETLPCLPVITLDSGHAPQVEMPEVLAEVLASII